MEMEIKEKKLKMEKIKNKNRKNRENKIMKKIYKMGKETEKKWKYIFLMKKMQGFVEHCNALIGPRNPTVNVHTGLLSDVQ